MSKIRGVPRLGREDGQHQGTICGHGSEGICSAHLDLSGYRTDELTEELRSEGYGGAGLAGSDDYKEAK